MMTQWRVVLAIGLGLLIAAPAAAQRGGAEGDRDGPPPEGPPSESNAGPEGSGSGVLAPVGNPSAVLAAEIARDHLIRDKGYRKGLLETADKAAEALGARRVPAPDWLRQQGEPATPISRATRTVWVSCDGSAAITRGVWRQRDLRPGWYATVWWRGKKANLRWRLDLTGGFATVAAATAPDPDFIDGLVGDCPVRRHPDGAGDDLADHGAPPPSPRPAPSASGLRPLPGPLPVNTAPTGSDSADGRSNDGTLLWRSTIRPDGARQLTAWLWRDGQYRQVLDETAAPAG